jgi:hypothetical protein
VHAIVAALAGLSIAGFAPPAFSQQATSTGLSDVVEGALALPELPTMAAGLLDTIGGRLPGTAAGTRAEAWAAGWLRSFGFDTVWHELVRIPIWRRGETYVRVVAPGVLRHRPIAAVAYGYSPGIDADSVPLIDIGRGDALEDPGTRFQGAALLSDAVSEELIARAVEAGAVAVLRVSLEPGRLPQARVAPVTESTALPVLALSREDGLWLRRLAVTASPLLTLLVEAEVRAGTVLNVVGELRGRDASVADEVFLLGAHLDSWDLGDGALDNGTGVLSVMTAAGALGSAAARPRRTIRVVFFAAEELGLFGSREYVQAHAAEMPSLVAMMNLDMVGAPEGYGATGHDEADTVFARLAQEPHLRDLGLTGTVNHGGGPGSDHQPFLLAGVPTIYVQTSLPPETPLWYHNAADTFDKIELEAVRRTGAAVAAAVWGLADHPGRPLHFLGEAETQQLIQRLGW